MSAQNNDNRLTELDHARIRTRVIDTMNEWTTGHVVTWADTETICRMAANAVGCSFDSDLRDSERNAIRSFASSFVGEAIPINRGGQ